MHISITAISWKPIDTFLIVIWGLAGLIVGSFINWASDYLPRFSSSSAVPSIEAAPRPVLALWHLLKTPTAFPKSPWQAVGVEIFAAFLFAYLWKRFGLSWQLLWIASGCSFFLLIAVIDLKHRLILNVLVYPAAAVVLLFHFLPPGRNTVVALLGGAVGLFPFLVVALMKPGDIGGGDVKLATLIGLTVGFPQVLWALSLGILAGGVTALFLLLTRRWELGDHIPYAPFLCLGVVGALVYDPFSSLFPL